MKPLMGRKVIGFEHAWTGPYATMMLADMGADVVKIEPPGTGDHVRKWTRNDLHGFSPHYLSANRNKRSAAIDLKTPGGRDLALDLIGQADVLVENFSSGTMNDLGLGYETAAARNPKLVYCSVNGFGHDGPYAHHRAYDLLIQAEGGLLSVTGIAKGRFAKVGVPVVDLMSAMVAAFSAVCGMIETDRTGKGKLIDISMLEVAVSTMAFNFFSYVLSGEQAQPMGTAHPLLAPYETYPTKDAHIALAILTEAHWATFCAFLGREDLVANPAYCIAPMRVENREKLNVEIAPIFLTETAQHWVDALNALGLACARVNDVVALIDHPQLAARNFFQSWKTAGFSLVAPGAPWRPEDATEKVRLPPALGEHTFEVLREWLDLESMRIEQLASQRVIAGLGATS